MTITVTQGIGYVGRLGERPYVAEITGCCARYGLARMFATADSTERDHYGRARYLKTFTFSLTPGLYEVSERGKRHYLLIWTKPNGEASRRVDADRAQRLAERLDAGDTFDTARRLTKSAATVGARP